MAREIIKGFNLKKLGEVETSGRDKKVYDAGGRLVATYESSTNITKMFYPYKGAIAFGDVAAGVLLKEIL